MGKSLPAEKLVNDHVAGIRRLLAEIADRVSVESIGLDVVDAEVASEFIDIAAECASSALFALHPEWDDLDEESFENAMRTFEEKHRSKRARPKEDPREDLAFVNVLVMLLAHGVISNVLRWPSARASNEIVDEMENVIEIMAFVSYLLDPDGMALDEVSEEDRSFLLERRDEFADVLRDARERAIRA